MKLFFLFIAALLFQACANTEPNMLTSFRDLTSEVERESETDLDQNRIFSVSGSMPQAYPGQVIRYDEGREVSTGYGITASHSFLQSKTFVRRKGSDSSLMVVLDAIIDAQAASSDYIDKRFILLELEVQFAGSSAVKPTPAEIAEARAAKNEATVALKAKTAAASRIIQDSGVLVVRWDASKDNSFTWKSLFGLEAKNETKTGGFLILAGVRETTLFVGPDILLGGGLGLKKRWDWIASDFPWLLTRRQDQNVRMTTHTVQAQYIRFLQDQQAASRVAFEMKMNVKDLTQSQKLLLELGKVDVQYATESVSSLSNQGLLVDPQWSRTWFHYGEQPFYDDDCPWNNQHGILAEVNSTEKATGFLQTKENAPNNTASGSSAASSMNDDSLDGWTTIYAVDTNYWELRKMFDRNGRTDLELRADFMEVGSE